MLKKLSFRFYFPDNLMRILFWISTGISLASWILGAWTAALYYGKPDLLVLHQTIYFGIDLVGLWYRALFLPLLGTIFLYANFMIARYIWKKDAVLGHLMCNATVFIEALILLAVFGILMLNI
jgi:hypothetical protein